MNSSTGSTKNPIKRFLSKGDSMKKIWLVLTVCLLFMIFPQMVGSAEDQPRINYSVEAILPENQQDKTKSYFDLLVEDGEQEELSVAVTNTSDQPIVVEIRPYTASTSPSGGINYNGQDQLFASSLEYSFEELISETQTIHLTGGENQVVTFAMQIPEKGFKGTILGGFYIKEITDKKNTAEVVTKESQATIINEFSFVIGVKLQTELTQVVPNFTLETPHIKEWNDFFSLNGPIVNDAPMIVSNYEMEGEVLNKKTGKVVLKIDQSLFSMAPNSKYINPQKVNPSLFPSGQYLYKVTIKNLEQTWQLEKEFTVTEKERKKVLENTVNSPKETNRLLYYVIALLLSMVIVLGFFVLNRKERSRE